ncbi:MAG: response regulator [Spirochaetaceae bacterium]|nr:response regulator [Spirochaetaceae bacterium]
MKAAEKGSVLIVDDERANIATLTNILSPEYTIYAAKNGQDAIETAKKYLPDVILLDIIMPEMDGYEVFSRLKSIEETRSAPIIFITGLAKDEEEEKGMALGASDYITKPFTPGIVKLRVQNQMQILNHIKMIKQSSIVENSPQFIIYLSPGGGVNYVNPAALNLTGHTTTEIMANGLELIFGAETAQKIKDTYIPNTLQKETDNFEINMTRKDGKIRILAFTSFTAEKGNIGAIAQDVTEMREMETELITAKEQAEQSSRAKSEFLSRMSHEMRTPMNAIIGMTNIAKISKDPNKKTNCLEEIENASRHLRRLIDDVLDISSLEKNTVNPEHSNFSFIIMLQNVLKGVKLHTEEKQQTLSYNVDQLIPDMLFGDEKRLAQVIQNLLMNATKFTPANGAIQLNARVFGKESGVVILMIEISDNGIGIPKEKQATIFSSFEQADGSLSREFGGAGLGLTISKYIVEMMGGKLWVESELGKGAKFTFTFKAKNISNERAQNNNIVAADGSTRAFEGKAALLVEDVEINREILMLMLEGSHLQIDCAENGQQAVELFTANPGKYNIILMDINMPVMDGWEATRRIRALDTPEGKTIKIVALTANTQQEDVEKSLSVGINDHIGKPIDFDVLLSKLNQYLK